MKYAFYPGCTLQSELYGCELSIRETLPRLGVELIELTGASCCGYQTYSVSSPLIHKYLVARNLALAEQLGLDILTPCNGCHYAFNQVKSELEKDNKLSASIDEALSKEGLRYEGKAKARHLLDVLYDDVTVDELSKKIRNPQKRISLASHIGCLGFRPERLNKSNIENLEKFDDLIHILGAETVNYEAKLDCCGYIASLGNEDNANSIAEKKLNSVKSQNADGLIVICPLCFKMLDRRPLSIKESMESKVIDVPVIYYTQLLGLAMGLPANKLGLDLNKSKIEAFLPLFKG